MYESNDEGKENENQDNTVEEINKAYNQKGIDAEAQRLKTIHQMELNRQQEEPKPEIRDKVKELSEALGLTALREDIDSTKTNIQYLAGEMGKLVSAVNNINNSLSNGGSNDNPESNKMAMLGQLIDSPIGKALADRFLAPQQQNNNSLLSQDYINEKLAKSATSTFELGEAFMAQLQSKVMGKALGKTINSIIDYDEPA